MARLLCTRSNNDEDPMTSTHSEIAGSEAGCKPADAQGSGSPSKDVGVVFGEAAVGWRRNLPTSRSAAAFATPTSVSPVGCAVASACRRARPSSHEAEFRNEGEDLINPLRCFLSVRIFVHLYT